MRKSRSDARTVGSLVSERLSGLQIEAKIREHTAPLVWAEVVGPQVAGATRVLGIENGVLRVSTKSAVWSNELTFYKVDIVRRLNARITRTLGPSPSPAVSDIFFQNRGLRGRNEPDDDHDAPSRPLAPTPEELDDVALSPHELTIIEAGVAAIQSDDLRARLRALRIADARLRTWRLDNGWAPCARCGDLAPPRRVAQSCPRCRVERHLGR